jgi:hypothetical protein
MHTLIWLICYPHVFPNIPTSVFYVSDGGAKGHMTPLSDPKHRLVYFYNISQNRPRSVSLTLTDKASNLEL